MAMRNVVKDGGIDGRDANSNGDQLNVMARRVVLQAAAAGVMLSSGLFPTIALRAASEGERSAREKVFDKTGEPIIDPDLPIVDPHHHFFFLSEADLARAQAMNSVFFRGVAPVMRRDARYLLDELLSDVISGHNVRATVFIEAHAMYRAGGPEAMKSVGEVEFANGVAAMAASGAFGDVRACAGIVGNADLSLGDAVEEVLSAHIHAGNGRYRGVRTFTAYDPDSTILGAGVAHVLLDKKYRAGFKWLHKLGLSFETFLLEPQLADLIDLARAFPDTQIILDHIGTPLGVASYAGKRDERFPVWRDNIRTLSGCDNVAAKLGGLGSPICGFRSFMSTPPFTSEQLAVEWKPYIETCIEAFGANRCMFESNSPMDSGAATYPRLWNTFKRLAAGASKEEKTALFSGTAKRIYRLDI
jgi:L-fuconolactonase